MIREQNGKGDNDFARIKDKKAEEMEERRRLMEKSAEKKRQLRQQHIERKETLEAEKLQRAETATDLKIRQLKRRERLAEELARRKRKGTISLKNKWIAIKLLIMRLFTIQTSSCKNHLRVEK
ncbi:hypothetical protein K0M31_006419 [Melipona bicolor]|uniref:Uncharacterized protein n=1 Tax=Melipona bicolor TaxID=60889 RepID=A0AA40KLW6_9HYME|nr:hypothetical protein K0M31_006419 [Melipona bicolor]